MPTDLLATANVSVLLLSSFMYLRNKFVVMTMPMANPPPTPTRTPYPAAWGSNVTVDASELMVEREGWYVFAIKWEDYIMV